MARTIKLKHKDIQDSQKITEVTERAFEGQGLNIHVHEVESIKDDPKKGIRILEVKNTKYFSVGNIPWKK